MELRRHGFLRGTLDLLVLNALATESMHGYQIARWLERRTDQELTIEEGSLYPALHRMAKRGWIEAEWRISDANRRAKYYTLTKDGRVQMAESSARWRGFVENRVEGTRGPALGDHRGVRSRP